MNVFERLNLLNENECIEADKIADSISEFIINTKNLEKYRKIELYNLWLQQSGIVPTTDDISLWAVEYLSYVVKEIPIDLLKLQVCHE